MTEKPITDEERAEGVNNAAHMLRSDDANVRNWAEDVLAYEARVVELEKELKDANDCADEFTKHADEWREMYNNLKAASSWRPIEEALIEMFTIGYNQGSAETARDADLDQEKVLEDALAMYREKLSHD